MPRLVSVAIVHSDPPAVFIAENIETMNWVLALKLVARTQPHEVPAAVRTALQSALLDERWGEAVVLWMKALNLAMDVYESEDLYTSRDVDFAPTEIQFTPLFSS